MDPSIAQSQAEYQALQILRRYADHTYDIKRTIASLGTILLEIEMASRGVLLPKDNM